MLYTTEGSNPVTDQFYIRPPSASTYYDENPIKWVMHGVFGVYSTNSYFSFLFSFDVLTRHGHFCLLGLFLFLDYVYIITGFQFFVKGLKESFLNITKSITLEGIEPSLFYSNTTKPPGAGQSPAKGIEPFLCILSKLTLQKTLLVVSLLYLQYNRYSAICQQGNQSLFSYFYLCVISATHNIPNITGSESDVKPLSYKI